MRRTSTSWLIAGSLGLALIAAGCEVPGSVGQPTAAPATSAPPSAAPATALPAVVPTTSIPATVAPEPTSVPPTSVPPTATAAPAEPIALLPASAIWVRTGATIVAVGREIRSLDTQPLGFPAITYAVVAAPDGSHVAYVGDQDQLVVLDMSGVVRTFPEGTAGNPVGFSFAPDSGALAFTMIEGQDWRLQVLNLASGAVRTLQEGNTLPQQDGTLSLMPRPIGWTPTGILVEHLLWASDAPPQGPFLVDPADGATRSLAVERYLRAAPTVDGARLALVTGEVPIGGTPTMEVAILDVVSGQVTTIAPERQGFVKALRWSPDGARLLYAAAETYDTPVTSVYAVGADGSGEQRIDIGVQGLGPAFRDLAWRDGETALVLLANEGGQLELHELSIHAFDPTGLKRLEVFDGAQPGGGQDQIVYVPRVQKSS